MMSDRQPGPIPVVFDGVGDLATRMTDAMAAARSAQAHWACVPLAQRVGPLRELRRLIAVNGARLAEASASARLRPRIESLTSEVLPLLEACRFLEREAAGILRPRRPNRWRRPLWLAGVSSEVHREPFGVVLIIGPGNYPLLLPGVQLLQALIAGNAVMLKPGTGGTAASRVLCDLIVRAGLDPQLITLLPEPPDAARAAIAARPDKVLFTGSTHTGELILAQLAPHLIPATMELGGCDAAILRADADLDLVVKALVFGLRLNDGATCMSPKRVFVPQAIAAELEARLKQAFDSPGTRADGTRFFVPRHRSPAASSAIRKLRPLVEDALARGARLIVGAIPANGPTITPLVLAGLSPDAGLLSADIFAPVLALVSVADDEEALRRTNDCPFGLTVSLFTRDERVARSLALRLNAGVVTINDLIIPTADARLPFGGRKRSGFGVTRGAEGLLELTTPKVITFSRGGFRPAFDAPQPGDAEIAQAYLQLRHGRGWKVRWTSLISLVRSISRRGKTSRKTKT